MSGIYIHIPICKSRCIYCSFYSTIAIQNKVELVNTLIAELEQRKKYLPNTEIQTIYFGGGTPSLLSIQDIERILQKTNELFCISNNAEITLESNPDDLTPLYLQDLRKIGINRLSIGIQSFEDNVLAWINRRHSGKKAVEAVRNAQKAGFHNISIDLMYGFPNQSIESWCNTIDKALSLNIQHISAYELTYEEGTQLYAQLQNKTIKELPDETINAMYDILVEKLEANGITRYEVSNFSQKNFHSQHNSSYWVGTPYLGIGPAAHSFNGVSRQWNVSSLKEYIQNIGENKPFFEKEVLTEVEQYNEFVMLALRTTEGFDLDLLKSKFNSDIFLYCTANIQKHIDQGYLELKDGKVRASKKGFKLLNLITETLVLV